jgi:hypothetical protein
MTGDTIRDLLKPLIGKSGLISMVVSYPELFDREHLTERVWLYDICFRIRQLCGCKALDPRSLKDLANLITHPRVLFG